MLVIVEGEGCCDLGTGVHAVPLMRNFVVCLVERDRCLITPPSTSTHSFEEACCIPFILRSCNVGGPVLCGDLNVVYSQFTSPLREKPSSSLQQAGKGLGPSVTSTVC